MGEGWKVGLSSISFTPLTDSNEDNIIMSGIWNERVTGKTGLVLDLTNAIMIHASELQTGATITDGVSLMTGLVNRYERWRLSSQVLYKSVISKMPV